MPQRQAVFRDTRTWLLDATPAFSGKDLSGMIDGRTDDCFARTGSTVVRAWHSERSALREGQQVCIRLVGMRDRQPVRSTLIHSQLRSWDQWGCFARCRFDWCRLVAIAVDKERRHEYSIRTSRNHPNGESSNSLPCESVRGGPIARRTRDCYGYQN